MGMEGQSRLFNFVGNAFLFLFSGVHSFGANTFIVALLSPTKPVSNQGYMYFQTRQLTMAAIRTTIGTGHHSGNIGVDCLYFLAIVSLWDYPDNNTSGDSFHIPRASISISPLIPHNSPENSP